MPLTPTARTTPAGQYLYDGLSTKITLKSKPAISFWEKTVKPFGADGGDAIDVATMFNVRWRVRAPRQLMTATDIVVKALYDPNVYNDCVAAVNKSDEVTVTFPNGDTIVFYGFLRVFEPDEASEANAPMATITISPTNMDPVTGAEAPPVISATPTMAMFQPQNIRTLAPEELVKLGKQHGIEGAAEMDQDNLTYALCRLTVDDKKVA